MKSENVAKKAVIASASEAIPRVSSLDCRGADAPPAKQPAGRRNDMLFVDLGLKPYAEVLSLQEETRNAVIAGDRGNTIILCQHQPVYTTGRRDCSADFLSTNSEIARDGIAIVATSRGGRVTYHGPGQLVVYFLVRVADFADGVKELVHLIEETCISLLNEYSLFGSRRSEHPGIWLADKKIAAIGLHISEGVSMHGMAINISPDMSHYRHIVPCGIREFGVTSMREEMGEQTPSVEEVGMLLKKKIGEVFESRACRHCEEL